MRPLIPFTITLITSLTAFTTMAFYLEGWFVHSHVATDSPPSQRAPAADSRFSGSGSGSSRVPGRRERAKAATAGTRPVRKAPLESSSRPDEIPDDLIRAGISALTN